MSKTPKIVVVGVRCTPNITVYFLAVNGKCMAKGSEGLAKPLAEALGVTPRYIELGPLTKLPTLLEGQAIVDMALSRTRDPQDDEHGEDAA